MSKHHDAQSWSNHSKRLRPIIAATLPQPCIGPRCFHGGVVYPGDTWQVGHILDAALGGQPTIENVGPIHRKCNASDGGKKGRALQLGSERDRRRLISW